MSPIKVITGTVIGFLVFVLGLTVILGSWYTVDQTERGVILRNGAIAGTAQPGLGFKTPWIESVEKISVQSHLETFDKMSSYSTDQQPAELRVSVNYHAAPDKVAELYSRFGSLENAVARIVRPHVFQQTKVVFGQYSAVSAIQNRGKLNTDVTQAIMNAVDKDSPIVIESVQVENIDYSQVYLASIEQRMQAEVEVQRMQQQAQQAKVQAEITVTKAKAAADAVRAEAQAQADATKLKGDAEASAIKARGDALKDNPDLVALTQAERWNGQLPATMIPGNAVPMLTLK